MKCPGECVGSPPSPRDNHQESHNGTFHHHCEYKDKEIVRTPSASKSNYRDWLPLRHLIRVMRKHDLTNEETNETLNILNSCDVLEEEEANPRSLVASKGIDGKLSWLSFHLKISPRKHFCPKKGKAQQ